MSETKKKAIAFDDNLSERQAQGAEPAKLVSLAEQAKRNLELVVLLDFMRGKRLKQLCRPYKLTLRQVEDVLRSGLNRRAQSEGLKEKTDNGKG